MVLGIQEVLSKKVRSSSNTKIFTYSGGTAYLYLFNYTCRYNKYVGQITQLHLDGVIE